MRSPYRHSQISVLLLLSIACSREHSTAPELGDFNGPPPSGSVNALTTLTPTMDSYIRQGAQNQNQGNDSSFQIQSSGKNRGVIQFSTGEIQAALSGNQLVRATLVLRIKSNGENWGSQGRPVDLHTLTVGWTETGVTWNCAIDALPTNQAENCSGATKWFMDGNQSPRPYDSIPIGSTTVLSPTVDSLTFDVTTAVAQIGLTGNNAGWLLKKRDEGDAGKLVFYARESGFLPRLVLETKPLVASVTLTAPCEFEGTVIPVIGAGFDGNNYYVIQYASASTGNLCISRYGQDGTYLDRREIHNGFYYRGLHWSPTLLRFVMREPSSLDESFGRLATFDPATGALGILTPYNAAVPFRQYAPNAAYAALRENKPAISSDGLTYWALVFEINGPGYYTGQHVEQHLISDGSLVHSFPTVDTSAVPGFSGVHHVFGPAIAVTDRGILTLRGTSVGRWDAATGALLGEQTVIGRPATNCGGNPGGVLGASSTGDRVLYTLSCSQIRVEPMN